MMRKSKGRSFHLDLMRDGRVETCNATGEKSVVDPVLSSLDNSRLTQLGSYISTDQVNLNWVLASDWILIV